MSAAFTYHQRARSKRLAVILGAVWLALAWAWGALDASPWIILFLAAFTLPALWDLVRDPAAGLTLDDETLRWHSGRRKAELPLEEIAHIRLDTRLDFSVRATAVLQTGRKVRLPFESTPPHRPFEEALMARGLKVERHHFTLMQ
ncbi:MAG: hypothetical protein P1U53_15970 [Sulfitobacter sp.]|nr:hypothetical protein [Sulfitobacter sp.]